MMFRAPRLLASLLNRPHLIEPSAGAAVLAVLAPQARLDGYDGGSSNEDRSPREYAIVNSVAVIPVVGELAHRGVGLQPSSGLCSYQAVADSVVDALSNRNVRAIVYDFDTPGGTADGCLELAERLRGFRGIKPTASVINVRATSAGYALACSADRVYVTRGGYAGSIGVVAYHVDLSKALADDGIVVTYLYAGARKIDGAPELPLSDEARAEFQGRVDALYGRFCEVVAAARPYLSADAVKATEAGIFMGEDAVRVGLADDVSTLEEVIMTMQNTQAPSGARLSAPGGGPRMSAAEPSDGPFTPCKECTDEAGCRNAGACAKQPGTSGGAAADAKPADPAALADLCHKSGFPELTSGLLRRGASMADVQGRLAEAKAILDAGQRLRQPDMARRLIAEGVSEASARAILGDSAALADSRIVTDTAHASVPSGGKPPALDHKSIYARMNAGHKQG